jgi:hypothetical protein
MEITIAQRRFLKQIRSSLHLMQKYVESANTKMSHGRATNVSPLSSGEGVFRSVRRAPPLACSVCRQSIQVVAPA